MKFASSKMNFPVVGTKTLRVRTGFSSVVYFHKFIRFVGLLGHCKLRENRLELQKDYLT